MSYNLRSWPFHKDWSTHPLHHLLCYGHSSSLQLFIRKAWILTAKEITSSLHQKLKFTNSNKIIVVGREEDILVSHMSFFLLHWCWWRNNRNSLPSFGSGKCCSNSASGGAPQTWTINGLLERRRGHCRGWKCLRVRKILGIIEKKYRFRLGY